MEGHQHIKSVNNRGGKNRLRFSSARDRAKRASADVYRSSSAGGRRLGILTGSAGREERVHNPIGNKKKRKKGEGSGGERGRKKLKSGENVSAVITPKKKRRGMMTREESTPPPLSSSSEEEEEDVSSTSFASELELTKDRNASELFTKLYHKLWPLTRSLPEILHHVDDIIKILLMFMLSPECAPYEATKIVEGTAPNYRFVSEQEVEKEECKEISKRNKQSFVVNLVTTDTLHLLAVLARDLRHEIHPYVYTCILPRIVNDLINPPSPVCEDKSNNGKILQQARPLDVSTVECAFRTLSYIFKYDSDQLLKEEKEEKGGGFLCLEQMRQYYGATLGHRRDYVRRLAAESFAPLIRKMKSNNGVRRKHLRRVVRALAASAAAAVSSVDTKEEEVNAEGETPKVLKSVQRAQNDAIDGVSLLLFYTARGVPGRLHSKAQDVIGTVLDCCVLSTDTSQKESKKKKKKKKKKKLAADAVVSVEEKAKGTAICSVASEFFYKMRGHIQGESLNFVMVWDELYRCLDGLIDTMSANDGDDDENKSDSSILLPQSISNDLCRIVSVMEECISFRNGILLGSNVDSDGDDNMDDGGEINDFRDEQADRLSLTLSRLLDAKLYRRLPFEAQGFVLKLLCSSWKANPDHPVFASRLTQFLPSLTENDIMDGGGKFSHSLDPALVLARDLLPYLPRKLALKSLVPAVLVSAAKRVSSDGSDDEDKESLVLLHVVATSQLEGQEVTEDDNDNLFSIEAAKDCTISCSVQSALLDVCLRDVSPDALSGSKLAIARLGYAVRCIPFLTHLGCSNASDDDSKKSNLFTVLKRVNKWYISTLKALAKVKGSDGAIEKELCVAKALVMDALGETSNEFLEYSSSLKSQVEKTLSRARSYARDLLFAHPQSIWTVKGVALLVKAMQKVDVLVNDNPNDVFDLLVPNLRSSNHFLRLHTLEILNSYPALPFVVDHADLNITDDLDEEPSFQPPPKGSSEDTGGKTGPGGKQSPNAPSSSSSLTGTCDLMSTLLSIESTPVNISSERFITSGISRVEVLGRSGKLPVIYAEAAANYLFGSMYIKFAPIWPCAVRAIVTMASAQEDCVWSPLEIKLKEVMNPLHGSKSSVPQKKTKGEAGECTQTSKPLRHLDMCVAWDETNGIDTELFGNRANDAERDGRVSRHQSTDYETIFGLVWSVMEGVPQLTTRKSRVVVPVFLRFLHKQYYLFHNDDPDAREFCLSDHIEDESEESEHWSRQDLTRRSLQKKLTSFFKMFAAVNGPQQLFKHKVLLRIFVANLSNPDVSIVQLAFSCVMKYKLHYVLPYAEQLHNMLKKGELRDTLAKFDISKEAGVVNPEHREGFIPILTRILFGRFSARGSGAKSSKDSPAARRAAILSFFAVIGKNNGELDYFVYMMVRNFIPRDMDMKLESDVDKDRISRLIKASQAITSEEISNVHSQKQQGFLNLLSDVISQLGFGVKEFVPSLLNLVLTLCEHTENTRILPSTKAGKNDDNDDVVDEDMDTSTQKNPRVGNVRALCFRRLSDIFTKYSSSFNFTVYGKRMWDALTPAIISLPDTVIGAEKPPALLTLLESISSQSILIPLLAQQEESVKAVFRCIDSKSRFQVLDSALKFVDNLLTEGGTLDENYQYDSNESKLVGLNLIHKHIHLLIEQFTKRLSSSSTIMPREEKLAWRELGILCRVTELLVANKVDKTEKHVGLLEELCKLLVPFLKVERKINESNQINVLGILKSVIPKIRSDAALSHLQALSKLLGPNKSYAGISSFEIRQLIVSVIGTIAAHNNVGTASKRVASALEQLSASHPKRVDEWNFDEALPVLNNLGNPGKDKGSWLHLSGEESGNSLDKDRLISGVKALTPLMYTCFHLLYDLDGVISRGAFKALKTLISTSANQALLDSKKETDISEGIVQNSWLKLIETAVAPSIRMGFTTSNAAVRRNFILLLSEVSRSFTNFESIHLYGDMRQLIRDDNPELDFFLNVTHVQIHRRGRAFARLRKMLTADDYSPESSQLSTESKCPFSMQSLANILLPLAMHPVYECKKSSEETLALEAIATVGALAKHLSWSKYQSALWGALIQLPRHPDQERYLIGMICAIIDAFHFKVTLNDELDGLACGKAENDNEDESCKLGKTDDDTKHQEQGNAIWRALQKRIIPKIEGYLIKEKVERSGTVVKTIRSPIALALMKLFQKLPLEMFELKLPRLLTEVCNALKSRESDSRDIAKRTLANMAASLDIKYLSDIIRELAISLSEGYRLHVRSAALHSVLLAVSKVYQRPETFSTNEEMSLPFDKCVPAIMDLIQQDLFGIASEMKETKDIHRRVIKEAIGVKSYDTLEIICRTILFKPSLAKVQTNGKSAAPASVVHTIISPLLERMRDPEVGNSTLGKVKECLNRIVIGISHNTSANAQELLPFVYVSVSPFVGEDPTEEEEDSDDSDDDEDTTPIQVTRSGQHGLAHLQQSASSHDSRTNSSVKVTEWLPSTLKSAKNSKKAHEMKKEQKAELHKVKDGASAPKLTGKSRYGALKTCSSESLNDPATASAVVFCLSLLHACLKRSKLDVTDEKTLAMADPYVPLLTTCVQFSSNNDIISLSLKCLGFLLKMKLYSVSECSKKLGTSTLKLLSETGATSNAHNEIKQSCFKMLTLLMSRGHTPEQCKGGSGVNGSGVDDRSALPLDESQMKALILLLHSAVVESVHHNATFSLIKAITSKRHVSPEFYDLMEIILKLSVQSQKSTVRQQSCHIFMQFLIDYPMGKQRIEEHLKQILLNIKYEYEEGRISAIGLLTTVIQKLPIPMLEEHSHLFFLPLVLQLVNDDSKRCRELLADCTSFMLKRLSVDVLQSLYDYVTRWSAGKGHEALSLKRTSAQLFGIFLDARQDFMKRGNIVTDLISTLHHFLEYDIDKTHYHTFHEGNEWELSYFSLVCIEKLNLQFPRTLRDCKLCATLVKSLAHPHPWVKQVSSRIISVYASEIDPKTLKMRKWDSPSFFAEIPGSIYDVSRNLCRQLNSDNGQQAEDLIMLAIKTLTWIVKAMHYNPHSCFAKRDNNGDPHDDAEEEDIALHPEASKDPVLSLVIRLSNIAKNRYNDRREAVFKCFASFATSCNEGFMNSYLELVIEPLHRVITEASSETDDLKRKRQPLENDPADLAKDVLQVLEDRCGTDEFLKAYAVVKTKAREKRETRKREAAAEAVHDPKAAAMRKIQKHDREKKRKKRRVEERKRMRGAYGKTL